MVSTVVLKLTVKAFVQAVVVRVMLGLHSMLTVWRATDIQDNYWYWLLGLTNILLGIELLIRLIKYKGQESKWFSPCFLIFLMSVVPAIWFLELDRLRRYDEVISATNVSAQQQSLSAISGVSVPIKLEPDTWISVLEQGLLFFLIVGRWMLPRGKVTRNQLSQLLFVYLGIASDIMELFVIFEEPEIRQDRILTYVTLGVWSVSLLQFSITLTATKHARKSRGVAIAEEEEDEDPSRDKRSLCARIFQSEIWSLIVSITIMDIPFVTVRLYALVRYRILTYGILFFTSKNLLMIFLVIYRLIIVCYNIATSADSDDDTKKSIVQNKKLKSSRVDIDPDGENEKVTMRDISNVSDGGPLPDKPNHVFTINENTTNTRNNITNTTTYGTTNNNNDSDFFE